MPARIIRALGLCLRPLRPSDAPAIADALGRKEVAQWLVVPPWPFLLEHAERFLDSPAAEECHAVTLGDGDDQLRGLISLKTRQLGYWLHPDLQGRGVMSRAAEARVAEHFATSELSILTGVQTANAPSTKILTRLGFQENSRCIVYSKIRGHKVEMASLELTLAGWKARQSGAGLAR